METTRTVIAAILGALLCAPAAAAAADLNPGGGQIEIVDARGRAQAFTLVKPSAAAAFSLEGPGTLKVHVRQLVDRRSPLTRVPITVTVLVDGRESKVLKIQDKAQTGVQIKGQETVNPTAARMADVKLTPGRHEVVVKVSSSAVKGAAMRFEYDGQTPGPAVAAAPIPALVPLAPPKQAAAAATPPPPAPAPALVPLAPPQKPAVAAAPAPAPALVPLTPPQTPAAAATPPPPAPAPAPALVPLTPPKKEATATPPPAPPPAPAAQKAAPPPAPARQPATAAAVAKDAPPAAGKRAWHMVEFTPRVGVVFPLQMGNPAPLGGLNIYYYPIRWLGIGVEGEYYVFTRDFKVSSGLTGDQGAKYRLTAIPVTLDVRYEPYRMRGFAPFAGVGGGLYNVKAMTENDWGNRSEKTANAFGWKVFGGVNGKLGFGQIVFDLGYSQARATAGGADNVDAGGITASAGYQMGF